MAPTRKYEQTKLTSLIVASLKDAIWSAAYHGNDILLEEYEKLLKRIEDEQMDLRMYSRLE